ncbi:hypothetical protein ACS0TY_030227 [Phlomoides rotata]
MSVTAYTYGCLGVVNMLRQFTGQLKLCRASVTRMMRLKNELRKMFTSDNWTQSKWFKEPEGKKKKPAMGYIYEDIDRVKEAIMKSFNNEERYINIFEIIDKRWECQLHQPLHDASYFLNPGFFYANEEVAQEVNNRFIEAVERLVPDVRVQDKISMEL